MPWSDFEDRALGKQSLRSVFLWFFVSLLLLVADILVLIYRLFGTHRFPWSNVPLLALLGTVCFLNAREIYRRRYQQKT
jgi:hypothetical protein